MKVFLALQVVGAAGIGRLDVVVDVADEIGEVVDFAAEGLDLGFGATVDVEVEFGADAVFVVLAVLAHHDDRRLDGGEHGEEEVEQDVGVGIPTLVAADVGEDGVRG